MKEVKRVSFDEIVERRDTDALKYEGLKMIWNNENLIPMWVADMDFRTPDFIIESIKEKCSQGILGYNLPSDNWAESIIEWHKKRYKYTIDKEHLIFMPGVVKGIIFALQTLTEEGDGVMIMPPVYHPFRISIENNNREVVNCPLILEKGHYFINKPLFEEKIKSCKMFILCNPHNPGGRVWTREELEYIDSVCTKNNIIVISDEIHADLTLPGKVSYIYSSISPTAKNNSIVFRAPSKSFNMPGVMSAYCIIENKELRENFKKYVTGNEFDAGHIFSYVSTAAAYTYGEQWLAQLLEYLSDTINFTIDFINKEIPRIKAIKPQASYLIFLDCRELNMTQSELNDFFCNNAGLALSDGEMFGKEGIGFMRMNVGCSRSVVERALRQLKEAYEKL